MRTKQIILFILASVGIILFFSCKKKFDPVPPVNIATGPAVTIAQLRSMFQANQNQTIRFTSNTSLYAVVTMDETSGNIYKQVYIRDNSGTSLTNGYAAINVRIKSSGGLYLGDSIMINLNGAMLDASNGGALQIDSLDVIHQVAKIKTGLNPQPIVVTLPQITSAFDAQLIQLNNVEFSSDDVGQTYAVPQAPPAAPVSVNRYINDCNGNEMVAYNSGYANFAGQVIPSTNGSIIAIANLYSTMQLTLRSYGEIFFSPPNFPNSSYCPIVIDTMNQTFTTAGLSDKKSIVLAGWRNIALAGSIKWQGQLYGASPAIHLSPSASNYKSTDAHNDIWFISPPIIDYGGGASKYMNFSSAVQYSSGNRQLSVLVSGSFDGVHVIPSQWTDLSASLFPKIALASSGSYPNFIWATNGQPNFTNASCVGFVPPSNSGTFYVAFRYRSNLTDSSGCTYLINNILIKNHP